MLSIPRLRMEPGWILNSLKSNVLTVVWMSTLEVGAYGVRKSL